MLTVLLVCTSLFSLTACEKQYTAKETDSLIADLQISITSSKSELDAKINALQAEYQAKDAELLAKITQSEQALETLRDNYDKALSDLKDKDLATDKAIADLDAKYLEEVEKLIASDNATAEALANLKANYDAELKELQDKDLATDKAIADLDAKYLEEVEKLIASDNATAEALANLKANYDAELKELQDKDLATDKAIADLDAKYLEEVEKLIASDNATAEALANLKANYDAELKELQDKDLATDKAIADLDAKYLEEVEKLIASDNATAEALANLKANYDAELKELQDKDLATDKAIADLDAKYLEETTKLQNDITTLTAQVSANQTDLQSQIDNLNSLYNAKFAEMNEIIEVLKTASSEQQALINKLVERIEELEEAFEEKHEHKFGAWLDAPATPNSCDERIYYRVCEECKVLEWKQGDYNDHEWNVVTIAPTCTEQGYDLKTCKHCGYEEKVNYVPVQHKWDNEYSYNFDEHWYSCAKCDEIKDRAEHEFDNLGNCTNCDAKEGTCKSFVTAEVDGVYITAVPKEYCMYTYVQLMQFVDSGWVIANSNVKVGEKISAYSLLNLQTGFNDVVTLKFISLDNTFSTESFTVDLTKVFGLDNTNFLTELQPRTIATGRATWNTNYTPHYAHNVLPPAEYFINYVLIADIKLDSTAFSTGAYMWRKGMILGTFWDVLDGLGHSITLDMGAYSTWWKQGTLMGLFDHICGTVKNLRYYYYADAPTKYVHSADINDAPYFVQAVGGQTSRTTVLENCYISAIYSEYTTHVHESPAISELYRGSIVRNCIFDTQVKKADGSIYHLEKMANKVSRNSVKFEPQATNNIVIGFTGQEVHDLLEHNGADSGTDVTVADGYLTYADAVAADNWLDNSSVWSIVNGELYLMGKKI